MTMLVEQQGLEIGLTEAEARVGHKGCRNTSARSDKIKLPRLKGSMVWTPFHCQFEAAAEHNKIIIINGK
jgi:hypothetical protein